MIAEARLFISGSIPENSGGNDSSLNQAVGRIEGPKACRGIGKTSVQHLRRNSSEFRAIQISDSFSAQSVPTCRLRKLDVLNQCQSGDKSPHSKRQPVAVQLRSGWTSSTSGQRTTFTEVKAAHAIGSTTHTPSCRAGHCHNHAWRLQCRKLARLAWPARGWNFARNVGARFMGCNHR